MIPIDDEEHENLIEKLDNSGTEYKVLRIYDKKIVLSQNDGNLNGLQHIKNLYSKDLRNRTVVNVSGLNIGESLVIAAGPCS
ncbi:MAG: hypothetical protein ACP5UV_06775, partial [Thermoplasmata archaeon]